MATPDLGLTRSYGMWPPRGDHIYLTLFSNALSRAGWQLDFDGGPTTNRELADRGPDLAFVSLHWPEHLWARAGGAVSHARALVGVRRYLRLARRMRVPLVWTMHNVEPHEGGHWWDRIGQAAVASHATLVICHSRSAQAAAIDRWPALKDRTVVMAIGSFDGVYTPTVTRAVARAQLRLAPNIRLMLALGLVRPYKGLEIAIDAVRQLGPPHRLLIAGPAADGAYAAELCRRAASDPSILFQFEQIADHDLANLYGAADCALLPYRRITGSAALLTALALGKGIVATDLPYFREVLSPNPDAGVLVAHDAQSLAMGIQDFFSTGDAMRHEAARRLSEHYRWDRVIANLIERLDGLPRPCERRVPK